jgi:DNA-binding MarR family transcriptional regulator
MTAIADPLNEILLAARRLRLDYRANPDSPDGPWRAQCPVCRTTSALDELPLTITSTGMISCAHGCNTEQIAAALIDAGREPTEGDPIPKPALPLLSISDLVNLPAPSWLVEDLLPVGFDVLFGPSNVGKSFLALDWSLCIASGLAWYGKQAKSGWVVYIAAEGVAGLYRRVQAWSHARNEPPPEQIRFIPNAVNLLDDSDVLKAATTITQLPEQPVLIVADTMARCMVGGDENAAKDVGRFIAAVDELRIISGAAALIVHHTGKDGEDERGSSALRGAADAMLALRDDGADARLTCVKQKDAAAFDPWRLHLETVLELCVLRSGTNSTALAPSERQILERVSEAFGINYASSTAIREAADVAKSSYHRSLRSLIDRGFLEPESDTRNARHRLTPEGQNQLVPASPSESHETSQVSPTRPSLYGTVGLGTNDETNNSRRTA